jgi:hypothetical protein
VAGYELGTRWCLERSAGPRRGEFDHLIAIDRLLMKVHKREVTRLIANHPNPPLTRGPEHR